MTDKKTVRMNKARLTALENRLDNLEDTLQIIQEEEHNRIMREILEERRHVLYEKVIDSLGLDKCDPTKIVCTGNVVWFTDRDTGIRWCVTVHEAAYHTEAEINQDNELILETPDGHKHTVKRAWTDGKNNYWLMTRLEKDGFAHGYVLGDMEGWTSFSIHQLSENIEEFSEVDKEQIPEVWNVR